MPQMAPILWSLIFIITSIVFLLFLVRLFFGPFLLSTNLDMTPSIKSTHLRNSNQWSW